MEEQEIKKILKEIEEEPSFGFSQKTMRKIESLESKRAAFRVVGNSSAVAYLIPLLLGSLIVGSLILLEPRYQSIRFMQLNLDKLWPVFNINFLWLAASLLIVTGFWSWIWWEKLLQKNG